MENITTQEELDQLLKDNEILLLVFTSPTCHPCQLLKPDLIELSEKYPQVKFVQNDIKDSASLMKHYRSIVGFGVPAMIIFTKENNYVSGGYGIFKKAEIEDMICTILGIDFDLEKAKANILARPINTSDFKMVE